MNRKLELLVEARPATDGDGVKLRRVAPPSFAQMDPILLLDEISLAKADQSGSGFPAHPHRGFETLTYMRAGAIEHRDHLGNRGMVGAGGAQWMHAGRGIVHSETLQPGSNGLHGFQLWLNLPAAEKMSAPQWRDLDSAEILRWKGAGTELRLIAGELLIDGEQLRGPLEEAARSLLYTDIALEGGATLQLPVSQALRAQVYVYEGSLSVCGAELGAGQLAVLGPGDQLQLASESGAGLLLLAAAPVNEPVVQQGPFVMNTREEIQQALHDYRDGKLT